MSEMTLAEIARAFAQNHREHDKFLTKDLHDEVTAGLREDIRELKTMVGRLIWGVVALFFTIVGEFIISAVQSGVP